MKIQPSTSRWALWVFVAALILRAAMPLLASASAEAQGKTMVEVCSVYGVSLVPLDGAAPDPSNHHRPAPGSMPDHEHCALTALAALAMPSFPVPTEAPPPPPDSDPPRARPSPQSHDACATWVARLKHGPPEAA